MFLTLSRKNMSQKLSLLLLVFGFIWGLMLLHYTFQHPRHPSSVELREQILDLSKRYVKALAEENKSLVNGENGASLAGYAFLGNLPSSPFSDHPQTQQKTKEKIEVTVLICMSFRSSPVSLPLMIN
ncbi:coiled-coil domain-containing protein 126 isoform X2 [Macrotis lagotis]|uniref:coiled-coil domain-containing protein 126 isoform X2 n=1 Tax=Macrotis lagotis TaxID=92651 RepID=UPI003D691808